MFNVKEDFDSSILKKVVIRIDYEDIFEISNNAIKKIKQYCFDENMTVSSHRMLNEEDFHLNDPVALRYLPIEYIEKCPCQAFMNGNLDIVLEVNQFFLRIIYNKQENSSEFSEFHPVNILCFVFDSLMRNENINVIRISCSKIYEVFLKNKYDFKNYIDKKLLNLDLFSEKIDWQKPHTQSMFVQNLYYRDCFVNFVKRFSGGLLNRDKYFRLYLEYEAYVKQQQLVFNDMNEKNDDFNIYSKIYNLNNVILDLLSFSLTSKAIEMLKKGERIGDL